MVRIFSIPDCTDTIRTPPRTKCPPKKGVQSGVFDRDRKSKERAVWSKRQKVQKETHFWLKPPGRYAFCQDTALSFAATFPSKIMIWIATIGSNTVEFTNAATIFVYFVPKNPPPTPTKTRMVGGSFFFCHQSVTGFLHAFSFA